MICNEDLTVKKMGTWEGQSWVIGGFRCVFGGSMGILFEGDGVCWSTLSSGLFIKVMPIHVFPCLPRICSGPDSDDIFVPQITKKYPSQLKSSSKHGNMGAANGFPWLMFCYFPAHFWYADMIISATKTQMIPYVGLVLTSQMARF